MAADSNPFSSPLSAPLPIRRSDYDSGLPIASRGRRLGTVLIDGIITQVLSTIAGMVLGAVYAGSGGPITPEQLSTLQVVGFFVGLVVWVAYYVAFEVSSQQTVGKMILGTMVVRADGEKPSVGQIIGRTFARFIPFEAFSFVFSEYPTGWHDSLSGTVVIAIR